MRCLLAQVLLGFEFYFFGLIRKSCDKYKWRIHHVSCRKSLYFSAQICTSLLASNKRVGTTQTLSIVNSDR
jgi:hypothetical protein